MWVRILIAVWTPTCVQVGMKQDSPALSFCHRQTKKFHDFCLNRFELGCSVPRTQRVLTNTSLYQAVSQIWNASTAHVTNLILPYLAQMPCPLSRLSVFQSYLSSSLSLYLSYSTDYINLPWIGVDIYLSLLLIYKILKHSDMSY